jgi:hypothetical protein
MKMLLKRMKPLQNTVNGYLYDEAGFVIVCTAEHPTLLIPAGTYTCFLQTHYAKDGTSYPAYEVRGVSGRKDIELHKGNKVLIDSTGCILIGSALDKDGILAGTSTYGFNKLMALLSGIQEFELTITDYKEEKMPDVFDDPTPAGVAGSGQPVAGVVAPLTTKQNVWSVLLRFLRGAVAVAVPVVIQMITNSTDEKIFILAPLIAALGKAIRVWFPNAKIPF